MEQRSIFLSGGTGYLGKSLSARLLARGHRLRVLARPGSEGKVEPGAMVVRWRCPESRDVYVVCWSRGPTFVHLTGVAHPAPWKEGQFRAIDLVSLRASAAAAKDVRRISFT